jgi:hypothetical protein
LDYAGLTPTCQQHFADVDDATLNGLLLLRVTTLQVFCHLITSPRQYAHLAGIMRHARCSRAHVAPDQSLRSLHQCPHLTRDKEVGRDLDQRQE